MTTQSQGMRGDAIAIRTGRRPISTMMIPVVTLLVPIYLTLAWTNPIIGASAIAVACQTLLFALTCAFIFLNPNGDTLDALKVTSVYYLVCFCIAPLFVTEPQWHFVAPIGPLAAKASAYLVTGYVILLVGYYLPVFRPLPRTISIEPFDGNDRLVRFLALGLFAFGFVSYAALFVRAGGIGTIIGGDEARNQWFNGMGTFLWAALFSYTGAILYFAARVKPGAPWAWLHSWPLVIAFGAWVIFQGRMRALNILVMGMLVSHYLIRPVRARHLSAFFAGGFAFSVIVGFTRNASNRYLLLSDPAGLASLLAQNFWEFSQGMMIDSFSRHRQIMLIFDKVPSWIPHDWGSSFLMVFNPPLRLVGLGHIQAPGIGPRLFNLAHPFLSADLETGYLPSLPGELLWNFPAFLALFGFLAYGIALRATYNRLVLNHADPCSLALYAVLLLALANMTFASVGQNLFELLVLTVPLYLIVQAGRLGRRRGTTRGVSWTNASAGPRTTGS